MKPKRSLISVVCELLAVLLISDIAFIWGMTTALIERGYVAIGGEYLLLLLPTIYYIGKQTILDWIDEFRETWKENDHG